MIYVVRQRRSSEVDHNLLADRRSKSFPRPRAFSKYLIDSQAVGMLFKRGSTISAAEGGCQAEVGGRIKSFHLFVRAANGGSIVVCSMAAAGFAACMGAPPETVLQVGRSG